MWRAPAHLLGWALLPFPAHPWGQSVVTRPRVLVVFSLLSKAAWFPELGCPLLLETLIAFAQGKHSGRERPVFHPPLRLALPKDSAPTGAP